MVPAVNGLGALVDTPIMQHTETPLKSRRSMTGWRIYGLSAADGPPSLAGDNWTEVCSTAAELSFDALSIPIERLVEESAAWACMQACQAAGLRLVIDCSVVAGDGSLPANLKNILDRVPENHSETALLLRGLARLDTQACRELLFGLRERHQAVLLTIWTPGMTPAQIAALEGLPIDGVYSSLPWWDFRHAWLVEEYERLHAVAPIIAPLADPREAPGPVMDVTEAGCRLAAASLAGEALLVPEWLVGQLEKDSLAACEFHAARMTPGGRGLRRLTGSLAPLTALFRSDDGSRLLLMNPDRQQSGRISRALIERRLPNGFVLDQAPGHELENFEVAGGGWTFLPLVYADWIAKYGTSSRQQRSSLANAVRSPRIAIESVHPAIDGGMFAVKRTLGETVVLRANIFMNGHEELAAELLWRPVNQTDWLHTAMRPLGNDAWEARIRPRKLGRYVYTVRAWLDSWRSYCVQLEKKAAAGNDVSLEVEEGRRLLQACLERARDEDKEAAAAIAAALELVGPPLDEGPARKLRPRSGASRQQPPEMQGAVDIPPATTAQVEALLDAGLAKAVSRVDERAFETRVPMEYPLSMERNEAMFSSWYELFPRSQSPEPGKHGTLRDVIGRLPEIRRMGFDVLYFPPIHPIGERNRKGRNNALRAEPGDPGSPYAIGSAHGGHDSIHPELGTLSDFRDLVAAAHHHGMEIALDFAIQCSPDHPWLREHPDWFNWRVDGSLKYAENPPKRYEDIVNPDFYSPLASTPRQAALWRALRDIVIFWVHQGVRIFRVDNPHTKPLPFWEWMLREVRDRHPDTIFLSEAFTRPAMMYRLAKLGFSQSYTYFTWRNTKQELTDYLTELNSEPVRDYFRPNFFVNTPDINPWFLQTSGRAGFLIRAVLAGTLSGSWGMYNGFELCVADAVPGKEEYLDSEKYQLRQWDMNAPGNIIEEITRLNRIRRSHPALQSHLGVRFHAVDNEQILFYSRHSAEGDSVVLVAVSLDPHRRQSGRLELPLDEWGVAADDTLSLHDLFEDQPFELRGRWQYVELTPQRPFLLWARVRPKGGMA